MIELALSDTISEDQLIWRNDESVRVYTRTMMPITSDEHTAWLASLTGDPTKCFFGVQYLSGSEDRDVSEGDIIGTVGLSNIKQGSAEFSIIINPRLHRKGFGTPALHAILNHGFACLDLQSIYGECLIGNPAIVLFSKLGLNVDGYLRNRYDNRSAFVVSMNASEWEGKEWACS